MKLADILILSLSVSFLIIGVHQTFYYPLLATYWLFMISTGLFFWYVLRKKKTFEVESKANNSLPKTGTKKKTSKKAK